MLDVQTQKLLPTTDTPMAAGVILAIDGGPNTATSHGAFFILTPGAPFIRGFMRMSGFPLCRRPE
jgi:hypothetical protein